jgi:hypothetical protein
LEFAARESGVTPLPFSFFTAASRSSYVFGGWTPASDSTFLL